VWPGRPHDAFVQAPTTAFLAASSGEPTQDVTEMSTTHDRLCAILLKDFKVDAAALTPEVALESLGIDSLGTVELLWNVEEVFRIKLPAEPVRLLTLGDVVRYIDSLLALQDDGAAGGTLAPAA